MTIIERLQQHKDLEPHKMALIVDDIQYTYGELYDAILSVDINNTSRIVNLTQSKKTLNTKILLIQELSFVEQLTQWLGALHKGNIPMVCRKPLPASGHQNPLFNGKKSLRPQRHQQRRRSHRRQIHRQRRRIKPAV
ncbi:MAG: hypothetical protein ACFNQH_01980, partial [Veillonella parvula]